MSTVEGRLALSPIPARSLLDVYDERYADYVTAIRASQDRQARWTPTDETLQEWLDRLANGRTVEEREIMSRYHRFRDALQDRLG